MPLMPFGSAPSSTPNATRTTPGKVLLGAFCYNQIPAGVTVVVPSGATMLQAGNLDIAGDLDLTLGEICWVD